MSIDLILLILAFICFVMEALKFNPAPRVNLLALGLALWVLTALI